MSTPLEPSQHQADAYDAAQPISEPARTPDPITLLFQAWIRPKPADAMRSLDIAASTRGVSDEELAELMFLCFRAGHLAQSGEEVLRADAGDLYDVLSIIVHRFDEGQLKDVSIKGVWLIDEMARDLVEKHS
jgi:hypothetical protein